LATVIVIFMESFEYSWSFNPQKIFKKTQKSKLLFVFQTSKINIFVSICNYYLFNIIFLGDVVLKLLL
jgi:hypothetical protein